MVGSGVRKTRASVMRRYGFTFLSRDEGHSLTRNFRGAVLLFGFFVVMTFFVTSAEDLGLIVVMALWAGIYILFSYFSESFLKTFLIAIIIVALSTAILSIITLFILYNSSPENLVGGEYGYWFLCGPISWCIYHFAVAVHAMLIIRASNGEN